MSGDGGNTLVIEASEFQRLQTQLIELRTTNYQLKEDQQKLVTEIGQLRDAGQTQSRELEKANKALQKSKKAKEMSAMLEENNSLQLKLHSQEEDFNLQNRTLMEELNRVCEESESLKSQVKSGAGGRGGDSEGYMRLKAENAALQKSLHVLQEQLSNDHKPVEEVDGEEPSEGHSNSTPKVLELQLHLDTEREEKTLLVKRLEELQELAKKEQAQLQTQLDTWVDKAKKKQDSYVHLQEEKEKLFIESRATFDEMVRTKDHDIQGLKEQIQKLSKDLMSKEEMSSVGAEIAKQLESLSTEKEELSLKCTTLTQDRESVAAERDGLKALAEELGRELHQSKAQLGEQKTAVDYLSTQLEEARLSQEQLADQVARASEERQTLKKEMEAAQKLAEKRKALVDEMSIKGQQSAEEQRRKTGEREEKLREEVVKLERELDEERAEIRRLSVANDELPELRKRMKSLEEKQECHDAALSQLQATLNEERESHEQEVQRLATEHEAENESLQAELSGLQGEVEAGRERVRELEVELADKEEKVRIVERKSNGMLKDLKRQLQHMQRKEEKRQEQLAEMTGGQALEHVLPAHLARDQSSDNLSTHSRESSLSSIRGHMTLDGSGAMASPSASQPNTPVTGLQFSSLSVSEDTKELLTRVTSLQREKWELEERVGHLETTGSTLAEDVKQKSKIIKSYFMENKADHAPQRRTVADKMSPMRLLAKNKEDMLNEINRKMQRALEEALVKNIHLHENIEMLTSEMEKRKTLSSPAAAADAESTHSTTTETSRQDTTPPPDLDHMTVT